MSQQNLPKRYQKQQLPNEVVTQKTPQLKTSKTYAKIAVGLPIKKMEMNPKK
jgi:hypothetical protein